MSVYLYSGYLFEYGPLAVFLFFWIITAVIVYVSLRKLMNRVARILLSILLSFIFAVLLVAKPISPRFNYPIFSLYYHI